jgi:predicted regulator of Ras-like GTPase activity (Roadblock/LC7/MglB family)
MPYRSVLDSVVRSVRGAQAALMFDALGDVVIETGETLDRHRLIGAYQGIALATAQRTLQRHAAGGVHYMLCRYAAGDVILRPLKDGYYLIVSLASDGDLAHGIRRSAEAQERMNAEL